MKIKTAKFIRSIVGSKGFPEDEKRQVAFLGRSNVGKSSVINSITGIKQLARSSSAPGHTKEINFFLINNKFYIVDLPGYGYARGSKKEQEGLRERILWYINQPIKNQKIILIIDAKVGITQLDEIFLHYLIEKKRDFTIVANKIDKLNTNDIKKSIESIHSKIGPHNIILFSTTKKIGTNILLQEII